MGKVQTLTDIIVSHGYEDTVVTKEDWALDEIPPLKKQNCTSSPIVATSPALMGYHSIVDYDSEGTESVTTPSNGPKKLVVIPEQTIQTLSILINELICKWYEFEFARNGFKSKGRKEDCTVKNVMEKVNCCAQKHDLDILQRGLKHTYAMELVESERERKTFRNAAIRVEKLFFQQLEIVEKANCSVETWFPFHTNRYTGFQYLYRI